MSYYLGTPPSNLRSPEPSFTNDPAPPWAPMENRGSYTQPPPYERPPAPVSSQWYSAVSRYTGTTRGGGIPSFYTVNPLEVGDFRTVPRSYAPPPEVYDIDTSYPRSMTQQQRNQANVELALRREHTAPARITEQLVLKSISPSGNKKAVEQEEDVNEEKVRLEQKKLDTRSKVVAPAEEPKWLQDKRAYLRIANIASGKDVSIWRGLRNTVKQSALVSIQW